jgi:class 3 adenylate cyclase
VSEPRPIPPALRAVIAQLEATEWAADVFDDQWRLVWVSDAVKAVLDETSEDALGYGEHILVVRQLDAWRNAITPEMQREVILRNAGYWMHETPGGREALLEAVPGEWSEVAARVESEPPPPLWAWELAYQEGDLRPVRALAVGIRLHDDSGRRVGAATIFAPGLPARISMLLLRGDEAAFERMARLIEPARRPTAILFADLADSSALARRLEDEDYFRVINALMTPIDEVVLEHKGLIGKHVGDGLTAFFPVEAWRATSATARSAIEAARGVAAATQNVLEQSPVSSLLADDDCRFRIGVHWGEHLYLGQLITDGRLEVTALGEEVNEAARIEQAAEPGELLVSRDLLEQLSADDTRALAIDHEALSYRAVRDLDAAGEKAVRDAGGVRVAALPAN